MKGRLPTVLSATALLIALASLTPVGQAARDAITPESALCAELRPGRRHSRLAPPQGRTPARPRDDEEVPGVRLLAAG